MSVELNFARRPFRDYRAANVTVALAAVLGLLLFALNLRDFFAFRQGAADRVAEISRLNDEADRSEQLASGERAKFASMRLKDLQTESLALNSLVRERQFSWLRLLSQLEKVIPEDALLTSLAPTVLPNGTATLTVQFVGRGPESIVSTLRAFSKSPFFSDPIPKSETDPEKGEPEGFQFQIQVLYRPEGGA